MNSFCKASMIKKERVSFKSAKQVFFTYNFLIEIIKTHFSDDFRDMDVMVKIKSIILQTIEVIAGASDQSIKKYLPFFFKCVPVCEIGRRVPSCVAVGRSISS